MLHPANKVIRRWDSERELFYDDIRHILSTIDLRQNYGTQCLLKTGNNKKPSQR